MAFARGALTRRDLLRRAGMAGGVLAGAGLLAACGSSSSAGAPAAPASSGGAPSSGKTVASSWTFSNWPLYIDTEKKTHHPSLDQFDKKYNTTTKYLEDIEDNESFFGKVKAQLEAGQDIKRDIVTLTDWMAGKWVALGYAEKLDKSPASQRRGEPVVGAARAARSTPRTTTWCRGSPAMTGIAYNPKLTGGELTASPTCGIRSSRAR